MRLRDSITTAALVVGVAVPVLYYGLQAAAAPFYPGFSFVATTASELGSDLSPHARLFNAGIMAQGVAALIAAAGFLLALLRLRVHPLMAVPTALMIATLGVQSLWAGYYPLPDPRHGGHPLFVVALILLPLLLAAVMWGVSRSRWVRAYFVVNLLLLGVMIPVMSGATGLDTQAWRGLLQRTFTLAIFPPIGVAALVLLRRMRADGMGGDQTLQ